MKVIRKAGFPRYLVQLLPGLVEDEGVEDDGDHQSQGNVKENHQTGVPELNKGDVNYVGSI